MINRFRKMQCSYGRSPETLIRKFAVAGSTTSKSYCTNVEKRKEKVTLYSKISRLGNPSLNLTPELDDWVEKGNKVRFAELQRIIRDFRMRKRFSHALEVSEWMNRTGVSTFTPTEHAVQLDLIGRVRGFQSAENYFNNLTDQDKTDKTYGSLLHCYVRQRQTDKCISHLQKMKEMDLTLSTLAYNDIMCLYVHTGQNEKIADVLKEMKKNGASPDNLSYRICINFYGERKDIKGMENILKEMENQPAIVMDWNTYAVVADQYIKAGLKDKAMESLKKSEERLVEKKTLGYNHLISLHARLGNKAGVLRVWGLEKSTCKRCVNTDYITMLKSLIKLDGFEEAEKLLKEWETSGNCFDLRVPYTLIHTYIDKGLCDKARGMLDDLAKKGKAVAPDSWGKLAIAYVKNGETEKAIDCMRAAFSSPVESKEGWKPNQKVIECTLDWLREKGSVEDVESYVSSLRNVVPVSRKMYHTLLKAYSRCGKEVANVVERMKADKLEEDKETKEILSKV